MHPTFLVAITFGVAAAATSPSYLLPAGMDMVPPNAGVLLVRTILLAFFAGLLLGAALTRVFQRTVVMRFGALYAALLGLLIGALASAIATLAAGYLDPTNMLFAFTSFRVTIGVLAGLTAWTLLRLRGREVSPPDTRTRAALALLFASAALLVSLAGILPWTEAGDYTPTWRTPATAVAVTALPAILMASIWSAAFAGYLSRAASMRFGFLYTLILGFYALSVANAFGGSFLNLYIDQLMADTMNLGVPPALPEMASATFYSVGTGGDELWRIWTLPLMGVLANALTWAYLRRRERP